MKMLNNCEQTVTLLKEAWESFGDRAAIGTSFQGAGLVLIHLARSHEMAFPVFTIDTGFLFAQTRELKDRLEGFFQIRIEAIQSEEKKNELWQSDPDLCCTMRKVLPLQKKLKELDCWITGLRRDQSAQRAAVQWREVYEFEGARIVKLNPMAHWSRDEVWSYLKEHEIPYNPLHDEGYRSIGCWPCTRKTAEDEGERAGRWTGFNKTECGIHTFLGRKQ